MAVAVHHADLSRSDDLVAGFDTHRRALRAHCGRLLGSFLDADDAVQETMVRAWRASARFEQRCSTKAWLFRIATNVCLDMLRARRVRPVVEPHVDADAVAGAAPGADVVETVVGRSEAADLVAAVTQLPSRQRAAFVLREVFGWRAEDIAELLGCSVAAANSALQRARAGVAGDLAADVRVSPPAARPAGAGRSGPSW